MNDFYFTITTPSTAEFRDRGSKFIAFEEFAAEVVKGISKENVVITQK